MNTNMMEFAPEDLEAAVGGTFNSNNYSESEYADAGIRVVTHFFARDEFWWKGSNIGHKNANAVVMFCKKNGGQQPASIEEAYRIEQEPIKNPEHHGCDLFHLASS